MLPLAFCCNAKIQLTMLAILVDKRCGPRFPNEARLICKDGSEKMTSKPGVRPARPYFSSGPCAKRPGWSVQNLGTETLGRSHRAKLGKTRLK